MKEQTEIYNRITYPDSDYYLYVRPHSEWKPKHESSPMFHEDIEIKYILSDTAFVYINDTVYKLKKGDILVINPFDFHSNVSTDGSGSKYHLYMLKTYFLSGGMDLQSEVFRKNMRFKHIIRDGVLADILCKIADEFADGKPYWRQSAKALTELFFINLLRSYTEQNPLSPAHSDKLTSYALIEPALSEIHRDFGSRFTVSRLASLCSVSESYFCHIFKEVTGESPISYINSYRVKIADKIMESSRISAADAAVRCGFCDPNYFYRCYKKVHGHSVSEKVK